MCSFVFRVGRSELTFTSEGKLVLFEATFEVKNSSFFRLIEASGNTLSAALMSDLLFERLTSKKCGWSTAEFDGTDWVSELESLTFKVVTDQLQNLMIETGFQNLNHLLLMGAQTGLSFHSLVYIC